MKIHFLTLSSIFKRNTSYYYPLIKWRKLFKANKVHFSFFTNQFDKNILNCDLLFVDFRYYKQAKKGLIIPEGFKKVEDGFLLNFINKAKFHSIKTVLLHTGDCCLFRYVEGYELFDLILKKQAFSDLSWYSEPTGGAEHLNWRHVGTFEPVNKGEVSLSKDIISKIKIGWNIGLIDHRSIPHFLTKYSPANISSFFPNDFFKVNYKNNYSNRNLLFSFRGTVNNSVQRFPRRLWLETLKNYKGDDFIIGGKVNKTNYLKELSLSKIGLSPNGHGEICHRDFEVMINGACLFKTDLSHLNTWPQFYKPYETYIPISDDCSDLLEKIEIFKHDDFERIKIAQNGQNLYKYYTESGEEFVKHFLNQII